MTLSKVRGGVVNAETRKNHAIHRKEKNNKILKTPHVLGTCMCTFHLRLSFFVSTKQRLNVNLEEN